LKLELNLKVQFKIEIRRVLNSPLFLHKNHCMRFNRFPHVSVSIRCTWCGCSCLESAGLRPEGLQWH